MNHSPEPWEVYLGFDHHELLDANGELVATSNAKTPKWEDVVRAAACVNYCQGIPTEQLKQPSPPK